MVPVGRRPRGPEQHRGAGEVGDERRAPARALSSAAVPRWTIAAAVDDRDLVGEQRRLGEVVGDEHGRRRRPRRASRRARAPPPPRCASRAPRAARRAAARAGSRASARASATRWRSPPESSRGGASASASAPKRRSSSIARGAALGARDVREPEGDVAPRVQVREQRVVLEQVAAVAALGRQVDPGARRSSQRRSPSATRPRSGRCRPAIARSTVLLPAPDGPTSARLVPGSTSSSTSSSNSRRTLASRTAASSPDASRLHPAEQRRAAEQLHRQQQRRRRPRPGPPRAPARPGSRWRSWRRSPAARSG